MNNVNRTRLSDDELAQLHSRLGELEKNPRWKHRVLFVRVMFSTGMKLREALPVKLQDIRLDYDPPVIFVKNTRAGATNRYVQIDSALCPGFRSYIEALKKHRPSDSFLFPGRSPNRPNGRRTLIGWWEDALKEAGLRPIPLEKGTRGRFGIWESKKLPPKGLIEAP